jgi:hypothetical protein
MYGGTLLFREIIRGADLNIDLNIHQVQAKLQVTGDPGVGCAAILAS